MTVPKAPAYLRPAGRRYWRQAHSEREFVESHDVKRLEFICRLLDELASDEATVRAEGRFTANRWGQRIAHPALKQIEVNRILYLRCVRELGLDIIMPEDPRIRRQY